MDPTKITKLRSQKKSVQGHVTRQSSPAKDQLDKTPSQSSKRVLPQSQASPEESLTTSRLSPIKRSPVKRANLSIASTSDVHRSTEKRSFGRTSLMVKRKKDLDSIPTSDDDESSDDAGTNDQPVVDGGTPIRSGSSLRKRQTKVGSASSDKTTRDGNVRSSTKKTRPPVWTTPWAHLAKASQRSPLEVRNPHTTRRVAEAQSRANQQVQSRDQVPSPSHAQPQVAVQADVQQYKLDVSKRLPPGKSYGDPIQYKDGSIDNISKVTKQHIARSEANSAAGTSRQSTSMTSSQKIKQSQVRRCHTEIATHIPRSNTPSPVIPLILTPIMCVDD